MADMNYLEYCIDTMALVRDAMKRLDTVKPKILCIIQEQNIIGTLTDGDIRRFLLNGGKIDDLAVNAACSHPLVARTIEEAVLLFDEKNYAAIPIVNKEGKIEDIYIGNKAFKPHEKFDNIPIVINAGGKGTRLDPYTRILPKPLIPVGDLPIIELIMQRFQEYGGWEFHIIVNYKKELMKAYFADSDNVYNISWYDEEKPLGTGGGLSLLKNEIKDTFFFTNCDTLLISDYSSMLKFHKENHNTITMICAYKNIVIPYGVLEMGREGTIENIQEKPELSFLTNTGVYIVEPDVLTDIENDISIGFPDIINQQRQKGKKAAVYPISENEWMDMGQLPELEKMREWLEMRENGRTRANRFGRTC